MKKIIYGIVAMVFIAVISVTVYQLVKKNRIPPADEVIQQYYSYIEQDSYSDMYDLLDEQSQTNISRQDYIERNQKIYEGIGVQGVHIEVDKQGTSEKKVLYTSTLDTAAGEIYFANEAEFVKEDGHYRIVWKDSLIFPNLKSSDKVKVTVLEAERGEIYDRKGNLLAGKGLVSSVGLVPGKMHEDSEEHIQMLAQLLEMPAETIQKKLEASWVKDDSFVPVKKLKKTNQLIDTLLGDAQPDELQEKLLAIPGVMITDVTDRIYPLEEKAAHLTGYVQAINEEELEKLKGQGYTGSGADHQRGTDTGCK